MPHLVPAPCLRCACDMRATKGRRQAPPPPDTSAPPRVGDEGREGRTAPPPPEDKAARWGNSGERVRDGPHDRARRKHAPCKPQRGGHQGCECRVGRATTGATRQAPPPPAEGQVPRLVPAPCLRRAYARGRTARTPAPPHPLLPHPPRKGARTARRWRGDMGGGRGQTDAPGGETGSGRWRRKKKQRIKQTNGPGEESEEAGANTATYGGGGGRHGPARDAGEVPDLGGMGAPKENPPPQLQPSASPRTCVVLASCLRHACYKGKTTRAPPPPRHTPPPNTP